MDLRGQTDFLRGPHAHAARKGLRGDRPTTSMRMDAFTPRLLRYGVNAMIGKGERGEAVRAAIMETGAVYFAAHRRLRGLYGRLRGGAGSRRL